MKKRIAGMLVVTLLIGATVLPVAVSLNASVSSDETSPGVVDQEQPNTSSLNWLIAGVPNWQQFINQGNVLEEIELHIGNYYSGSQDITISIEETVGGASITSVTYPSIALPYNTQGWFTFDLPDVKLQRGKMYHIVIRFNPGSEYGWSGSLGDLYASGGSSHPDPDWDYAFRTIVDKSKPRVVNTPFLQFLQNFLQNHPLIYQLLQRFIKL